MGLHLWISTLEDVSLVQWLVITSYCYSGCAVCLQLLSEWTSGPVCPYRHANRHWWVSLLSDVTAVCHQCYSSCRTCVSVTVRWIVIADLTTCHEVSCVRSNRLRCCRCTCHVHLSWSQLSAECSCLSRECTSLRPSPEGCVSDRVRIRLSIRATLFFDFYIAAGISSWDFVCPDRPVWIERTAVSLCCRCVMLIWELWCIDLFIYWLPG